ncbi:MAG: 2Fe-2S iron-sulfur cluster binding domain-containing protein [Verrucomicrobia bacterium]|nr:2Fe-2S iron-sulfur cluster binding domain-containing protein [Verrucomicrobiota bacterium]MBU1736092.1 2Fe-2S iron-sulfur cluster binding domain-containing protein [Verrucomicrobiota bacterium]MBU1855517.1 2Fe-2S iron-sulfur cluster binding domain-containing protein [Verrucomicrobiota bacterium]
MPEPAGTNVSIAINDRPAFPVPTGQSLLAALKAHTIFVPSACGGRGVCGLCRVKVLAGAGPCTPREEALLSEADRLAGMHLACQVTVERDLRISIPNDFFSAREYKAEVIALRDLTPDIREITLQLRSPPVMDFKAGQYIQLRIPPYEQLRRTIYRAYSMASPPSARDRLELEVRQVLNGAGTTYLFKHLPLNTHVVFNGPYGEFYLRESNRAITLIAGGSGMAPMKAMLCAMQERKIRRNVRYFFGARARRDLFLMDEMQALEQSLPDFRFIPALSKPLPEDQWTGETGLITEVLDRHLEDQYPGEAYLCGSPAMIQACVKVLQKKGVAKDRIFYDTFA